MIAVPNRQEPDKWNLHAGESPQSKPCTIADVHARAVSSHANKDEDMQRDEVGDEDISTPRRNHVSIEQRRQRTPHDRTILDCLDPEEEGEHQKENGNGFVVVAASNRTGDITRDNPHESSGEETGRGRRGHLTSQEIHRKRRQARERRCKKHTDIADIDRDG